MKAEEQEAGNSPIAASPPETTFCVIRGELDILTEAELAGALRVKTQTLATWRGQGDGPAYVKLGKQVFYRRLDVRMWISRNTVIVDREGSRDRTSVV